MTETYTPAQENAGSETQTFGECTIASGETLVRLQPLGQVTASGELKAWAPGASDGTEKAVALVSFDITTTTITPGVSVIKGGFFNTAAIIWPGGVTDIQKLRAFVGTPISVATLV